MNHCAIFNARMTRYFLTTFAACKIYLIPQEWFVLNNSRMARVVLILKHFFCSFISKRFMVIVHEYFYSITKKVLVKARANTCHSQDLSYICFVNPQIVFVSVCYLLSLCVLLISYILNQKITLFFIFTAWTK